VRALVYVCDTSSLAAVSVCLCDSRITACLRVCARYIAFRTDLVMGPPRAVHMANPQVPRAFQGRGNVLGGN
jgi:hypothetical protein